MRFDQPTRPTRPALGMALAAGLLSFAIGLWTSFVCAGESPASFDGRIELRRGIEASDDEPPADGDESPQPPQAGDDETPGETPPAETPPGETPEDTPAEEKPSEENPDPAAGENPGDETPAPDAAGESPEVMPDASPKPADDGAPAPLKPDESAIRAPRLFEPTAVKGIVPGKSTRDELHAAWGKPRQMDRVAGGIREQFILERQQVRATIVDDVVVALALRLEKSLSVAEAAKRVEVEDVEPVDIIDEQGQPLGCAYPEHGVMLGFAARSNPPQVVQVVVEPIDPQMFLARAEGRLASRWGECLGDVTVAHELDPELPGAHWLEAEINLRTGSLEAALKAAEHAIALDEHEPEYRLTLAKILAESGDYAKAIEQVRGVVDFGRTPPHVAGRAYCLWGDFLAADASHDYAAAIKQHTQAIKLAEPLARQPNARVRRAAKELLVDAHLAVAHDIAWGRWQQKAKVVPKWIDRAGAVAEDAITRDGASPELRLRVCQQGLAALAGLSDPPEAMKLIRGASDLGKKTFDEATDPLFKTHVAWQLAVALCNAVEIEVASRHADRALHVAQVAITCFEQGEDAGERVPTHDFLLGRLEYRIGAIYAIDKANHTEAVTWFERAVPLLESPVPAASVDVGKHGEMFVSIAVSYWHENNRPEALRLTTQGVQLMEQATNDGIMAKAALAIPYGNLASMYEQMGDAQSARKYAELATRQATTKPK